MKRIISIALAFALITAMLLCLTSCGKKTDDVTTTEAASYQAGETTQPGEETPVTRSRLTGLPTDAAADSRLIGIVVENHPDARPQWGFSTPDMVVEYEVEGGITRMLWLYDSADRVPEMVGPSRSARHDAVEIAMGMDAIFVHIGGSTLAYDFFSSTGYDHLDGNSDESFHHKDTSRSVAYEHRSVVVGSQLAARLTELGMRLTTDKTQLFSFGERELSGSTCNNLHISYSGYYNYDFTYEATGVYTAEINGKARTDENGDYCTYKNLVILYTDTYDIGDSSGHKDLLLENGGSGLYVSGGVAESISWTKSSKTDSVRLYGSDGTELVLNPGVTYMGFVNSARASQTVIG